MELNVNTDGCTVGSKKQIGLGMVLYDENENVLAEGSKSDGKGTSNEAEYKALLAGTHFLVDKMNELKINPTQVNFRLDSELVVRQITGEYQCRNDRMRKLCEKCTANIEYLRKFFPVDIWHVPRLENKKADKLSRNAVGRSR